MCDSDASFKMLYKAQRLCANDISDVQVRLSLQMKWYPVMIDVCIFRKEICAAFDFCKRMETYHVSMTKTQAEMVAVAEALSRGKQVNDNNFNTYPFLCRVKYLSVLCISEDAV
jgi:hypothetical protein